MRKIWKSAGERKRREARFVIRERVASVGCDTTANVVAAADDDGSANTEAAAAATIPRKNERCRSNQMGIKGAWNRIDRFYRILEIIR